MKRLLVVGVVILCSGCSTLLKSAGAVEDGLRVDSEFIICKGMSIGAWMRAYGNNPDKATAWRTLCSDQIVIMPVSPAVPAK